MIKTYYLLTKPGIIMGNVITIIGGFALASRGHIDYRLLMATLMGLSLVIASACVFNNYIDRNIDGKMARTKKRALVTGAISMRNAIFFAISLGILGLLLLISYTNFLTVCIAATGFLIYVILYGIWKRRSIYGTLIGSIAGGVPPVVGYCAVSNHLDLAALVLFMIVVLWQMPHFFAIAMYRFDDYVAAAIPVLPVRKGMYATKIHMLLYVIAFVVATLMLFALGYMGYAYLIVAALLGTIWLILSLQGFRSDNNAGWARKMFFCSLMSITILCLMIPLDVK